ncbi:PhzF family phenazine biosynthesis protein [Aeromicrobium chenweiae]|uniref:Phenazine biosynthesis protein PhzF n=1 Tax=Aeromicrobium chenweiae TaxID=2079793 RepID=A0A2S0WP83_9ACTN|nr:PhzF family phenazine biosynthesis protein [Aeromicrobium chenweiae]AWB93127.1 phenazine biosynthesis protein PhzF [Aeromicrobium chenweiae]TGN34116.1 PhzF family phenazine biosynthesis protein [Aeromicrobium chenweiae]
MSPEVVIVTVFADGDGGGNVTPIVPDATGMTDQEMQDLARHHSRESAFVTPSPSGDADYELRFWVPGHEMEMCGHATVGAVWLLAQRGEVTGDSVTVGTRSGQVQAQVSRGDSSISVRISQPAARLTELDGSAVDDLLDVLGVDRSVLADRPVLNAVTSRVKTLVPVRSVEVLDALAPDLSRVEELCTRLDSTGLYPYAVGDLDDQTFDARQFPRSSGYPEDPATGIAAAALSFALLEQGLVEESERPIRVRQGRAMGRPSSIEVRLRTSDGDVVGCWLGGDVRLSSD